MNLPPKIKESHQTDLLSDTLITNISFVKSTQQEGSNQWDNIRHISALCSNKRTHNNILNQQTKCLKYFNNNTYI